MNWHPLDGEIPPGPLDAFHCDLRNCTLTRSGCARDWRLAPERIKKDSLSPLKPCLNCPIGAGNAGEPPRDSAPAAARKVRKKPGPPADLLSDTPLAIGNVTFVCESLYLVFGYGPFSGDEVRALRNRFPTFRAPVNGRPAIAIQSLSADPEGVWMHGFYPGVHYHLRPRNWQLFVSAIALDGVVVGCDALALLLLCELEEAHAEDSAVSDAAVSPHVALRPWLAEYPRVQKALDSEQRAGRGNARGRPLKNAATVIERALKLRFDLLKATGMSSADAHAAMKTTIAAASPRLARSKARSFERAMQRIDPAHEE